MQILIRRENHFDETGVTVLSVSMDIRDVTDVLMVTTING